MHYSLHQDVRPKDLKKILPKSLFQLTVPESIDLPQFTLAYFSADIHETVTLRKATKLIENTKTMPLLIVVATSATLEASQYLTQHSAYFFVEMLDFGQKQVCMRYIDPSQAEEELTAKKEKSR